MENMCAVLVNGRPLYEYGGAALLSYEIGDVKLTNASFQGVNRSTVRLLKTMYGTRKLTITVVFEGENLHAAKMQRSILSGALLGRSEIYIPDDGFFYDAILENEGAEEYAGQGPRTAQVRAKYQFSAVRRLQRQTLTSTGTVYCRSTVPTTDCRLTATASRTESNYQLGGAVFQNVTAGDVLVFDGIECKITKNGANAAATTSWIDFPRLVPGENTIIARDPVTVEYYPTFL